MPVPVAPPPCVTHCTGRGFVDPVVRRLAMKAQLDQLTIRVARIDARDAAAGGSTSGDGTYGAAGEPVGPLSA